MNDWMISIGKIVTWLYKAYKFASFSGSLILLYCSIYSWNTSKSGSAVIYQKPVAYYVCVCVCTCAHVCSSEVCSFYDFIKQMHQMRQIHLHAFNLHEIRVFTTNDFRPVTYCAWIKLDCKTKCGNIFKKTRAVITKKLSARKRKSSSIDFLISFILVFVPQNSDSSFMAPDPLGSLYLRFSINILYFKTVKSWLHSASTYDAQWRLRRVRTGNCGAGLSRLRGPLSLLLSPHVLHSSCWLRTGLLCCLGHDSSELPTNGALNGQVF